ncbi:hypothetical protein NP493_2659g00001, partial [Ridgeia piscesae]
KPDFPWAKINRLGGILKIFPRGSLPLVVKCAPKRIRFSPCGAAGAHTPFGKEKGFQRKGCTPGSVFLDFKGLNCVENFFWEKIHSPLGHFTQRLCSNESDAPLERQVHIVEKNEQFNPCTLVKPDNGGIDTLEGPCCHEASCHNTFASDDAEMDGGSRQNDLKMEDGDSETGTSEVSFTLTGLPWSVEEGMQDSDDNFAYPWS